MKLFSMLIIALTILVSPTSFAKSKLNYEQFAHLPLIRGAVVSPDGSKVAAIYESEAGPSVVVAPFGTANLETVAQLDKDRDRIDNVIWAGSNRLLVNSSWSEKYGKRRWRENRYFSIDLKTNEAQILKAPRLRKVSEWEERLGERLRLISTLPKEDDYILVQAYDYKDKGQAVFRVNVATNEFDKQFINRYNVNSWYVDTNGEVIFGTGIKENEPEVIQYWYRKPGTEKWKMIKEFKNMADDTFSPILVQDDTLWVKSNRELGRDAIWQFDPSTGEFGDIIYSHPKYDVGGVLLNGTRTRAIGVSYTEHFIERHYFDKNDAALDQLVANSFPGYKTFIASRDINNKKLLILAYKNDSPTKYFWLDLSKRAGGFWFSQYPYLEGNQLGKTEPFTYKARDGMELYGYLTMPPNLKAGEKPPLVIHPHGGPFGPRDDQNFAYMVQFLANMGYAVLQPNFRGSGGYGSEYQTAGYKEWGLKMQNDVYDSVEWLRGQGTVDVDNACVVGWSYGGYVALTAAFQKPKAYECIISIAGISDVEMLADEGNRRRSALTEFYKEAIGNVDIEEEKQQLKNASAINFVSRIKAPVLLIHGKNDTQVHYGQSEDFYEAADKAGVDIDYIEFETGTHYLDENSNRLKAFKAIEKFLKKHLN